MAEGDEEHNIVFSPQTMTVFDSVVYKLQNTNKECTLCKDVSTIPKFILLLYIEILQGCVCVEDSKVEFGLICACAIGKTLVF